MGNQESGGELDYYDLLPKEPLEIKIDSITSVDGVTTISADEKIISLLKFLDQKQRDNGGYFFLSLNRNKPHIDLSWKEPWNEKLEEAPSFASYRKYITCDICTPISFLFTGKDVRFDVYVAKKTLLH